MSLACHFPSGQAVAGEQEQALLGCQVCSKSLTERIQHLIDADVHAYREVTRCLRLPQATGEQRQERLVSLDEALKGATDVPLAVAEAGLEILDLAVAVAPSVRPTAQGDLAAAVHLAEAAVRGSLRNARINATSMRTGDYAANAQNRIDSLSARFSHVAGLAGETLRAQGVPE
jgi:formiminotetrahydrofolate cyclodeaminase